MSNNNQTVTVGPGFLGCLGLLFIGLKLTGYINWSWWLVLLPIYGPAAVVILTIGIVCIFAGFIAFIGTIIDAINKK